MHALVSDLLAEQAAGTVSSAGPTSAGAEIWRVVHGRLCPVIGDAGLRALVSQALEEAGAEYGFLRDLEVPPAPRPFVPLLVSAFREGPAGEQAEALRYTLSSVLENLESLIGPDLAARVVRPVGPDPDTRNAGRPVG